MLRYYVQMGVACDRCDEQMAHITSSRLMDPDKHSFHLFRCTNCNAEKAIFSTMADPRDKRKHGIGECKYCHITVAEGEEGVTYDPVACTYWHQSCSRAAPPSPAIRYG